MKWPGFISSDAQILLSVELLLQFYYFFAQLAAAVEYTDCISEEG